MKTKPYMILWLVAIVGAALPYRVHGAEIEGVRFNEVYEAHGVRLPVQGTGLFRYMGIFKVYVGAIYYEEGLASDDILADKAKRLEVEYFHAIKSSDFEPVTDKIIAGNVDAQTLRRIKFQLGDSNSLYRDVWPGDRYALTYIPGRGTELTLNGTLLGVIEGADLASALFSMWFGKNPMSSSFKEQLLGLK